MTLRDAVEIIGESQSDSGLFEGPLTFSVMLRSRMWVSNGDPGVMYESFEGALLGLAAKRIGEREPTNG